MASVFSTIAFYGAWFFVLFGAGSFLLFLFRRAIGRSDSAKVTELRDCASGAILIATLLFGISWYLTPSADELAQQAAHDAPEGQREAEVVARAEIACRKSLQCWGDKHMIAAAVYCAGEVPKLASYTSRWTDGMLEPKLSRISWLDQEAGTLTFWGDKIEFQNGFGAWQTMTYSCDFDPASQIVLDVQAAPGRL